MTRDAVTGDAVIRGILPPQVCAVEVFEDVEVPLFAEEEAVVARAAAKRRREFATVRHCARAALAQLGATPAPIVPGPRGAPQWPAGLVGSMTHCDGYRAAAVGRADRVITVGIDAEPHQPLPADVLQLVAAAEEREHLAALRHDQPQVYWDRLLFAAKESVYKAWFPLTGRWLGFEDARISFQPATGEFRAQLLVPGLVVGGEARSELAGRFTVGGGLVGSAIALVQAGGAG